MIDNENILLEYVNEIENYINDLERELNVKDIIDKEKLNSLFRKASSMKGLSNFLGVLKIADISSLIENIVDCFRKNKMEDKDKFIDVVYNLSKIIKKGVEFIKKEKNIEFEIDKKDLGYIEEIKETIKKLKKVNIKETLEKEIKKKINYQKYILFKVNNINYAIDILFVKEIIGILPITSISKLEKYIKGIINLRGKIIPVVDIRIKINDNIIENYNEKSCIIIIKDEKINKEIGIIVDEVAEIINLEENMIEKFDEEDEFDKEFLTGVAKLEDKLVMIINIESFFDILK